MAEDQLGPKSPIGTASEESTFAFHDPTASQRIRPGTHADAMLDGASLADVAEVSA